MPDGIQDQRAVIYPTLWKPIMVKGIPRDWAMFSVLVAALGMVVAGWFSVPWYQFYGIGIAVVMAFIGWLAAHFDPEFFSIFLVKLQIGKTKSGKDGNEYVA